MELRTLLLFGATVCIIFAVSSVSGHGGGGGKGKWMEALKKCGDGEFNMKETWKAKKECMAELKSKEGDGGAKGDEEVERRRRSPEDDGEEDGGSKKWKWKGDTRGGRRKWKKKECITVCAHKKGGVLDDSGSFSDSGAQAFVDKVYPESVRTAAFDKMKACATEHSSKFSMEDNCRGYMDFNKCAFKGHMEVCGIKMGGMFGGFGGKGKDKDSSAGDDDEE